MGSFFEAKLHLPSSLLSLAEKRGSDVRLEMPQYQAVLIASSGRETSAALVQDAAPKLRAARRERVLVRQLYWHSIPWPLRVRIQGYELRARMF